MILVGVLVNTLAIVFGALLGLLLGKKVPEKVTQTVLGGLGLSVLYVGIRGSLDGENAALAILSVVIGGVLGEFLDIDARLHQAGEALRARLAIHHSSHSFAEGFVTCTLVFCVGAMAIVGSLQSGLSGNHATLFAKAVLDGVFALVMATTLGVGVLFSAASVLVYQGALTLAAQAISGFLTQPMIDEMNCVGSLLIIGIALNLLGVTRLKIANFLLAPLLPILFHWFF